MRSARSYLLTVALALALGAGATTASGLVGGKQVKNASLGAKEFSASARKALRRRRGPRGPQGPGGSIGPHGPPPPIGAYSTWGPENPWRATLVAAGPLPADGQRYLSIGSIGSTTVESDAQIPVPMGASHVHGMKAHVSQAASGTRRVHVRVNGEDPISCTIPPGEVACAAERAFEARGGDRLAVWVDSVGAAASNASVVFDLRSF